MECLKSYPQYANAKFSYGGLMTQYRNGEAVFGFISEQTVVPDPDGGRTETLSTYDNAAGFTLRETSVYDARDLLVHVTYEFNDVEPVEIGIRYFLEKEPSVPGTRLHGLIAEAKGDLEDALGREIFTYSYDDAGTLLTKESYLSVIHGFKEISLSKKPVERITYGPNGQIAKTESFLSSQTDRRRSHRRPKRRPGRSRKRPNSARRNCRTTIRRRPQSRIPPPLI